ncbi:MAG TPA: OmpA family protein [Acetobacteraceae bacterium]|nr:OmpA family protein [Acetobacteraceae bacterium]
MRRLIAPLLAIPLIVGAAPVFAQSNPSADQIIQSLKPKGNLLAGGTRGIRLAPQAAAPAPRTYAAPMGSHQVAAAKPMAAPPASEASAPSVNLNVDFETGSANLTPQARSTLDQLGRALSSSQLAGYRFRIVGHTDTVGSPAYNKTLSEQRADAVVHYLSDKFGVQPTRLEAEGVGEAGLLVPTPPQTPEPRNRRVQVINLGA